MTIEKLSESRDRPQMSEEEFIVTYRSQIDAITDSIRWGSSRDPEFMSHVYEGAIRAYRKFDPEKGMKFSSYLFRWIRSGIHGHRRSLRDGATKLSRQRVIDARRRERKGDLIEGDHAVIRESERQTADITGYDIPGKFEPPDRRAILSELQGEMSRFVRQLSPRKRETLIRYYGLGGEPPESSRKLAKRLGVSDTRIREIVRDGVKDLREIVPDHYKELLNVG